MKLRTVAAASLGAAGVLAATNRQLRVDRERLDPPLGRELSTYRWRGFDVRYTEAGDPADPDLLLLHGINAAGSSHEFSRVVDDLAEDYHVLAPDLPGFGHSDRPPLLYSGSLYVAFLTDFSRDVVADPTVVASSLTGAYTAVAAEEVPARELVLIRPTSTTMPGRRVWLRSLIRAPLVGQGAYNAVTSRPAIRRFLRDHGFADPENVPEGWVEYAWRSAHLPGGRFAPASFVGGFLDLDIDLGERLGALGVPITVVWGSEADRPDPETGRATADAAGAAFLLVDDADLFPHAEQPEEFLALLEHRREAV